MERRCITRQDIGHQRTLTVGAVYNSKAEIDVINPQLPQSPFIAALEACISEHPILSTTIHGGDTEAPEFTTPGMLVLTNHFELRERDSTLSERQYLEHLLVQVGDEQFSNVHLTPPWKVVVVPLDPSNDEHNNRVFVLLAYYHSHGDGKSALAFHQTFLKGLNQALRPESNERDNRLVCEPPTMALLPAIETAGKLSISWSFLISPLLQIYLPETITKILGFSNSNPPDTRVWRGRNYTFDAGNFRTGLKMLTVEPDRLSHILAHCRARRTTFSGLIVQLVVRAITEAIDYTGLASESASANALACQIVVDMRRLFQGTFTDDSMTNCVTAYTETSPFARNEQWQSWTRSSDGIWEAARNTSAALVKSAGTLHDQPTGLLQYLKEFRPWTQGQIGKKRECSMELSNLTVFDPDPNHQFRQLDETSFGIEKVIFAQPANAAGALLNFNIVSTKNGPLVMTVTWQLGVLGLEHERKEPKFVRGICWNIERYLNELAAADVGLVDQSS